MKKLLSSTLLASAFALASTTAGAHGGMMQSGGPGMMGQAGGMMMQPGAMDGYGHGMMGAMGPGTMGGCPMMGMMHQGMMGGGIGMGPGMMGMMQPGMMGGYGPELSAEQREQLGQIHQQLQEKQQPLMQQLQQRTQELYVLSSRPDAKPEAVGDKYAQVFELRQQMAQNMNEAQRKMRQLFNKQG